VKATPLAQQSPATWRSGSLKPSLPWPLPPFATALGRGLRMVCPVCGQTKLFSGYLSVTPVCANCRTPLGQARADDAPPYFTIAIVGHTVIPAMWTVERAYQPPLWVHAAIWVPLTLILTLLLLRPIKGATVGLMLKLGMVKSGSEE
jgi:uncharacterized protein (DUF983 family)